MKTMTFGFGQRAGQIVQMAYTVRDIHAAMAWWITECRVGPWFLIEHFGGHGQIYRGQPSFAHVSIAMAFAGHMTRRCGGSSETPQRGRRHTASSRSKNDR